MTPNPPQLAQLFHRRWAVPIIAEMHAHNGCRFAQLTNGLDAGRQPIRDALDALIELGLVKQNQGYGHPLRPEYVLTERGVAVGPASSGLITALRQADAIDIGLRKWSMPTLACVGLGASRFAEIARNLGSVTDRALSKALGNLDDIGFITREIADGRPPTPTYALTGAGVHVHAPVVQLVSV